MKIILAAISILSLFFLFGKGDNKVDFKKINTNTVQGFAVVELFTSEGCSSCPSADALVARLSNEIKENIYVLSYHVDYWNRLGWKDVYSKPSFTARQQEYVEHFGLNGAYTPQVVVNGKQEFVGSNSSKLYATVQQELQMVKAENIVINAKQTDNKIIVNYAISLKQNTTLHFALILLNATTKVFRGENEGKQLKHINIVKDIVTIAASNQQKVIEFSVPQGFDKTQHKIIAFMQDDSSYNILAAKDGMIL